MKFDLEISIRTAIAVGLAAMTAAKSFGVPDKFMPVVGIAGLVAGVAYDMAAYSFKNRN